VVGTGLFGVLVVGIGLFGVFLSGIGLFPVEGDFLDQDKVAFGHFVDGIDGCLIDVDEFGEFAAQVFVVLFVYAEQFIPDHGGVVPVDIPDLGFGGLG
jgi:hypothetical protein